MASKNTFSINTAKSYDSLPPGYTETVTITALKFFADGNLKKTFTNIPLTDPTSSGSWSADLSGYSVPLVGSSGVISADVEYKSPSFSFIQSATTSSTASIACDSSSISASINVTSI